MPGPRRTPVRALGPFRPESSSFCTSFRTSRCPGSTLACTSGHAVSAGSSAEWCPSLRSRGLTGHPPTAPTNGASDRPTDAPTAGATDQVPAVATGRPGNEAAWLAADAAPVQPTGQRPVQPSGQRRTQPSQQRPSHATVVATTQPASWDAEALPKVIESVIRTGLRTVDSTRWIGRRRWPRRPDTVWAGPVAVPRGRSIPRTQMGYGQAVVVDNVGSVELGSSQPVIYDR